MHDDACPVRRGDAFILPNNEPVAFGVVLSVREARGLAFVRMQSGLIGWATLETVERGRELLAGYAVEGFA